MIDGIRGNRMCEVCHQEDERDIDHYLKPTPPAVPMTKHIWAHQDCATENQLEPYDGIY